MNWASMLFMPTEWRMATSGLADVPIRSEADY